MVAFFKGENNGTDSVGGHTATLQNGATYAAGKVGQALSFDGVDDRALLQGTETGSLDLTGSSLSIEAWIYQTNASQANNGGGQQSIFDKYYDPTNGADGYGLYTNNGVLSFQTVTNGTGGFAL